jgi:putative ABC transport system ATP-binding protein
VGGAAAQARGLHVPVLQPAVHHDGRRQRRAARAAGRRDPRQARKRREELLAELGITAKADAAPSQLSGGEQQRVALARALANEPSLLLADEPTGNLDSANTRDVLRLLRRAHLAGQTVVMVTHDAKVAGLADRVISLFDGMVADDAKVVPAPRRAVQNFLELSG